VVPSCSRVGVVALAVMMGSACSSPTGSPPPPNASASSTPAPTSITPAAPLGAEAPIGAVPWSQFGPGWTIAIWSPAVATLPGEQPAPGQPTHANSPATLYLVDPAGGRYVITSFPPPGDKANPDLVDWSGDGGHALFYARYSTPPMAISVDMHTGAQTTIPVNDTAGSGAAVASARYALPDGTAVLLSTGFDGGTPGTLKRVDLAGHPQLSYPTDQLGGAGQFSGNYLESADGTQLVLETANLGNQLVPRGDNSLVVVRNDGTIVRALPSPVPEGRCSPVGWWSATVVLAHCTSLKSSANQLWEVPLDGGAPIALTAVNSGSENDPGFGPDLGDVDAWQLPSGTFLQSEGACGSSFLSRLTPDGHAAKVIVPSVDNQHSVLVIGVSGDNAKLMIRAAMDCGPGTSLLTYDPAANTSTVLLGPPVNGGSVITARPYPAR
jgi:hypothetical protein